MLLRYQHAWSQAVAQYLPTEREMQGMIGEIATGLRSVCTRSFPELLVDIKMSREDVSSSEVAKATYTVGVVWAQSDVPYNIIDTHPSIRPGST